MRPFAIIKRFGLKNPVFEATAAYGHFGRDPYQGEVEVYYQDAATYSKSENGAEKHFKKVDFFAWEKLDFVEQIKAAFHIS